MEERFRNAERFLGRSRYRGDGQGQRGILAEQYHHGLGSPWATSEQEHEAGFSFGDGYHTFSLDWTPNSLTWSVDGVPVRTANSADDEQVDDLISPSQIRINVWASESPEWAGPWDDSILPVYMLVDWVEYYAWNGAGFDADPTWRDDFNTFDSNRWGKADWTFDGNRADSIPENAYVQNGSLVLALTGEAQVGSSSSSSSSSSSGGSGGGIRLLMVAFLYVCLKRVAPGFIKTLYQKHCDNPGQQLCLVSLKSYRYDCKSMG